MTVELFVLSRSTLATEWGLGKIGRKDQKSSLETVNRPEAEAIWLPCLTFVESLYDRMATMVRHPAHTR